MLAQDCGNSIADAPEFPRSCTKLSIYVNTDWSFQETFPNEFTSGDGKPAHKDFGHFYGKQLF